MGVWDTGTYETHKWDEREVMITFHGERVNGKYVLFRTRDKQWMIHRMDPPEDPGLAAPPNDLRPMLATLKTAAPRGDGWSFELKWDGIRAIGYVDGGRIRLLSRNGNDVTSRYPELRRLGEALGARDVVLDGEIVAFDESGRPSFELLQRRMHVKSDSTIRRLVGEVPVTYVLFDVLWLDGHSTMDLPYTERRALLRELGLNGASWQTPPNEEGDGAATIEVSKRFGLEGVVAKRLDSRYEPGRRSPAWIKVKNQLRQEFVVGGWQPGEKGRTGSIGSLLVGYYDGDVLHYAGKVGSGLSGPVIAELEKLFAKTARDDSPVRRGPRARRVCASSNPCSSSTFDSPSGRRRGTSVIPRSWARVPTRIHARLSAKRRFDPLAARFERREVAVTSADGGYEEDGHGRPGAGPGTDAGNRSRRHARRRDGHRRARRVLRARPRRRGSRLLADDVTDLVFDLSATKFLDSSGLRAILTAQRRLAERDGRLALRAPSEPVRRLLDITGLTDHFVVEA